MNAPAPSASPARLARILVLLVVGVALLDICFWKRYEIPGLAVPVFFLGLSILIPLARPDKRLSRLAGILLLLLGGSILAGAIETGWANTISFLLLTLALAGELQFPSLATFRERWLAEFRALLRGGHRLITFLADSIETRIPQGKGAVPGFFRRLAWTLPVLVLAVIFCRLLDLGNAVFNLWSGAFFDAAWSDLVACFDLFRISFWIVAAIVLLPLLWPVAPPDGWKPRLLHLPHFSESSAHPGAWPSFLALGVFNLMFFFENAADFLFLWRGNTLPRGVTYAQFVHQGTEALIVAVLLSALVLTVIFQQAHAVAGRRSLKALAHFWIAQNLFLLAGVALRLKLYIDAYNMTVERISLLIFLVLVAAGCALLALKIEKEKSLSWLLCGAALAVFATFYCTQFLNLAGWTAGYNVAQWERTRDVRQLDVDYLAGLGPAAWPALYRALSDDKTLAYRSTGIFTPTQLSGELPGADLGLRRWREWSLRAWWNHPLLNQPVP